MSDKIKKDRSPNYPKLPLEEALGLVKQLYAKVGKAKVKAEVAIGPLGYTGLNGASLTTLGTLTAYGLIERERGESVCVSQLAIKLIHPLDPGQDIEAKRICALRPKVFSELFSGGYQIMPEDVLANHLIQQGFTPDGAKKAASVFKANVLFSKLDEDGVEVPSESDNSVMPKLSREPMGQFVYPKPANLPPDITAPPLPLAQPGELSLPLESGKVIKIPKMTQDRKSTR